MNDLIPVTTNELDEQVVSGRVLHEFLEVDTPYTIWFERRIDCGFVEGVDFITILLESTGGRPSTDHAIKLDMAKELCMLEKNEKGKQARRYFIQIEKDWNSPEKVMARALKIADREIGRLRLVNTELTETLKEQEPQVLFAKSVTVSDDCILIRDMAKLLKQNGYDTGEKRFYERLRHEGYLIRKHGCDYNHPTQKSKNLGLFVMSETAITHSDGMVRVHLTPKVTGKGQIYFMNKFAARGEHRDGEAI